MQTMVRGIGIELDILGMQCNVLSKSFNNTCFYLFLCCLFLAAELLQQSISPEREMEVVLLTSRQLPETLSLQMCQDDRTKKRYHFADNHHHQHHHISDQRAVNYDYEVNESNPVSLRTLISDLGIVVAKEDIVISKEMWPHTSSKYFYALAILAPYRRL